MQLGDLFESASVPVVGRPVKFHVVRRNPDGTQSQALAEAVIYFVDEELRAEADHHAQDYLAASPLYKKSGIIPSDKRKEEEFYAFLIRALRDKDDPSRPFCSLANYAEFRRCLISDVVSFLLREYKQYVLDEYPEFATVEQVEEVVGQAMGK